MNYGFTNTYSNPTNISPSKPPSTNEALSPRPKSSNHSNVPAASYHEEPATPSNASSTNSQLFYLF